MSLTQPNVTAVRTIIATPMSDNDVQAFIDDATLVAESCSGIANLGVTRQVAIIKWLTAHLIAQQSGKGGQLTQESLGDASKSYSGGPGGLNLQATRYGQQACMLDTTGCLSNIGKVNAICELC